MQIAERIGSDKLSGSLDWAMPDLHATSGIFSFHDPMNCTLWFIPYLNWILCSLPTKYLDHHGLLCWPVAPLKALWSSQLFHVTPWEQLRASIIPPWHALSLLEGRVHTHELSTVSFRWGNWGCGTWGSMSPGPGIPSSVLFPLPCSTVASHRPENAPKHLPGTGAL